MVKNPGCEVDLGIAIEILSKFPKTFDLVNKIFLESDRLREWKKSVPRAEYTLKKCEYFEKVCDWATDLQKWRAVKVNL